MQLNLISGLPFFAGRRTLVSVPCEPLVRPLIDCDAVPPYLVGWRVREHVLAGLRPWDESRVALSVRSDRREKYCNLSRLRRGLKLPFRRKMMNANVAMFLIDNPHLIPETWRTYGFVGFLGTVYQNRRGERLCPILCWDADREWWFLGYFSFKEKWPRARPVACWD